MSFVEPLQSFERKPLHGRFRVCSCRSLHAIDRSTLKPADRLAELGTVKGKYEAA